MKPPIKVSKKIPVKVPMELSRQVSMKASEKVTQCHLGVPVKFWWRAL